MKGVIENLSADRPNPGRYPPASVEKAANAQSRNFHESQLGGGWSWAPRAGTLVVIRSRTVVLQEHNWPAPLNKSDHHCLFSLPMGR